MLHGELYNRLHRANKDRFPLLALDSLGEMIPPARLILNKGVFRLEIVAGTLIGGVALAYPLWRRWGREPVERY